MSLLVVLLPPADRLGAQHAAGAGETVGRLPSDWPFVLSADGRSPASQGQAAVALLPRADQTVLVLAEADLSWHQIDIPKAPAARLRAALAGVMEDALLEDEAKLHLALGSASAPGKPGWVAATDARRLREAIEALEQGGRTVDRVVPASEPGAWRGHFHAGSHAGAYADSTTVADDEHPWLTLSGPTGVFTARLHGGLARARLAALDSSQVRWTTAPAAAHAAERLVSSPVGLVSDAARALEAAQSACNLRQFDLAVRHRGSRALMDGAKQLLSAPWRPVRIALAALVAMQLVGLNAYAWQQRQALAGKREAMDQLVRSAHPGVKIVLPAPLQMQRETDRLRAAAGRPGPGDLETMLSAAAAAWPDGAGPAPNVRFEGGNLTLTATWPEPQAQQFAERIRVLGYSAEVAEGRAVVSRAAKGRLP
jgi:general secretion pathway protein L